MNKNRVFSMYLYIPVHTGISRYVLQVVHTKYKSTYQAVPVCTKTKSCMLDTHRGTDLVCSTIVYMALTQSIVSDSHTSLKSFLRNILVSMVYTSMYWYVLCTYQYIPVEQHVLYLGKGGLY